MAEVKDTRVKNALTKYEILDYKGEKEAPSDGWLKLAKWIPEITNESEDTVNSQGFYDGDGTEEENVDGSKEKFSVKGFRAPDDEGQNLVAKKQYETGDGRRVWFRVTEVDGTTKTSVATLLNIKTTGGIATEYQPFEVTISRDTKPVISKGTIPGV